jgi:hypothetical protein
MSAEMEKRLMDAVSPFIKSEETKRRLEETLRSTQPLDRSFERQFVPFVMVQVRDDDIMRVPERIETLISRISGYRPSRSEWRWVVMEILGPLVILTLGTHFQWKEIKARDLAEAVEKSFELDEDIRFVYGFRDGFCTLLGDQNRVNFGLVISDFQGVITRLFSLDFGKRLEVEKW